jgi:hypothetical protein
MILDIILRNNGLQSLPLPLWKLRVDDNDYKKLKAELRAAFDQRCPFRVAKEAALYYALWWSMEYEGGAPSREIIARDLGIENQADVLYNYAKKGLSQLRIPPIVREGRTHRFRTLLLQGGLPVKSIKAGNNKANYRAFLEGLIKYASEVGIDYEDVSFIDLLPCKNRLAPTFRTPEIYELSLQIVEDLINSSEDEDGGLLSAIFDKSTIRTFKDISKAPKQHKAEKRLFNVDWQLRKNEDNISLHYQIAIPQRINVLHTDENIGNQFEISVFINHKEVAKYVRTLPDNDGNTFFIKHRGRNELHGEWQEDSGILIRLSGNGYQQDIKIPPVPDFSRPVVLWGKGENWNLKKKQEDDDTNAILLLDESEWKFCETNQSQSIKFNDKCALWFEFDKSVKLINNSTGEEVEFDNSPSLYRYEVYNTHEVIHSKKHKLITSTSRFKFFYIIGDEEDVTKNVNIFYRNRQSGWVEYNRRNNVIPTGVIDMKFVYPNNKIEYAKFFNIGNLSVSYEKQSANSGVIRFEQWAAGIIQPVVPQQGIEIERITDRSWEFVRDTGSRHFASEAEFRISIEQDGFTSILVPAPFKGAVITDLNGVIVERGSTVALHSLWQYQCKILGKEYANVTIYHNKNIHNKRTISLHLDKLTTTPLSFFEEVINNLFILFGSDHTDYNSFVTLSVEDVSVDIKPFNICVDKCIWGEEQKVCFSTPADIEKLYALKVECDYPDEIDIVELIKKDDGYYVPENSELKGFICFSDANSRDRVRPTYLSLSPETSSMEERITAMRKELSISRFIDDIWYKVAVYFQLLVDNNLPFTVIDYFRVIAESPLLMVKMAIILLDRKIDSKIRIKGLSQFENDFAMAWHWIDNQTWEEGFNNFILRKYDDIKEFYVSDIVKQSLNTDTDTAANIRKLVAGSDVVRINDFNEQSFINNYMQKIGLNNLDDILIRENDWIIYPRINKKWQDLFHQEYGAAIRNFLWTPAKAALSAMGKDEDSDGNKNLLWMKKHEIERRIMFYYWKLLPDEYNKMFEAMLEKISYRLNNQ